MQRLPILTTALLALVLTVPQALAALAAPPQDSFRQKFEKALEVGAKDEMARLVQNNEREAIDFIVATCEAVANAPSERIFVRLDALKEAWSKGNGSEFVKRMELFFSRLDPPSTRERFRIKSSYDKATQSFTKAEAEKESGRGKLNALAEQFRGYAEAFEQLGDKYLAGNAWLYRSLCMDETHQGPKADLREVALAYGKVIKLRDELDLKDRFYRETLPNLKRLEGLGFGGGGGGAEGEGGGGAVATGSGPSTTVTTAFEVVEKVDAFERPNYFLDAHYPIWDSLFFQGVGSTTTLRRVEDSPRFIRTGASKIEIDLDGDGEGDRDLPTNGQLESVELELGSGATKRRWAFLAQVGNDTDQYQGVDLSNTASDNNWGVFIVPAGSVTATVGETELQVFDDNMDGSYGSPPASYGHVGLTSGLFQPEFDTISVDGAKRALPWSEYVRAKAGWLKLESQDGGARISGTPVELRTGKLKLEAKGVKPDFLIVQGSSDFENSFFDIAAAREVEVPVGRYTVYWGMVSKGKKKQRIKALVLPGPSSPAYDVLEGETVEVKFGAPYDFICDFETSSDSLTINGNSVTIIGAGGERYERIYGAVPRPEASFREVGSKRGSKPEDMETINDRDGFDRKGGYAAMWKPLDLELPLRGSKGDLEVRLTEKKNKLFGKIEGSWH